MTDITNVKIERLFITLTDDSARVYNFHYAVVYPDSGHPFKLTVASLRRRGHIDVHIRLPETVISECGVQLSLVSYVSERWFMAMVEKITGVYL